MVLWYRNVDNHAWPFTWMLGSNSNSHACLELYWQWHLSSSRAITFLKWMRVFSLLLDEEMKHFAKWRKICLTVFLQVNQRKPSWSQCPTIIRGCLILTLPIHRECIFSHDYRSRVFLLFLQTSLVFETFIVHNEPEAVGLDEWSTFKNVWNLNECVYRWQGSSWRVVWTLNKLSKGSPGFMLPAISSYLFSLSKFVCILKLVKQLSTVG